MRRIIPLVLFALILLLLRPVPLAAWGMNAHKAIMDRAISLLPPEIKPFFEKNRVSLVEHSIDPDTYRTVGWTEEPPRHFMDMDAYGPFPFTALPHDYDKAVAARGVDFVTKNGLLPWRTQQVYDKLKEAFQQLGTAPYAREDVRIFSSVLAHYLSDATQPFHAAKNYDGQLTGQWGIHARFEGELFDRYQARLNLAPAPVTRIPNIREFTFATLSGSYQLVDPILAADRAAVAGRDEYDDAYFEQLLTKTQPILEKRVSQAMTDVASAIASAWMEAGKPALPADAPPQPPRKVRRGDR
jgi:hypothetical protein